jgi:hypothetical protein
VLTRTITFQTAASPDEVIAYYEDLRNNTGYIGFERETLANGVQAQITDDEGPNTGRQIKGTTNVEIVITATPHPSGLTTVTVQARGPDLP